VSIATIVKACDTTKGAIYHHFPAGKEQLLLAAIDFTESWMIKDTAQILKRRDNPIEAIQQHIEYIATQVEEHNDFVGIPIGNIAGEMALKNELVRQACATVFLNYEVLFQEKLMISGFAEDDAKALATTLNALYEGGILLSVTHASGEPLRSIAKQIPYLLAPR
jgi:TetR/AcrR family transcriptional repressor of lmrAB and yxaGH operons